MKAKSSFKTCTIQTKVAVIGFAIAGLLVAVGSVSSSQEWPIAQTVVLVALSIATSQKKVRLSETSTISLLTSSVMLALMVAGTGVAVVAGICGVFAQNVLTSRKLVAHQLVFNAGMIALTVGATGAVYRLIIEQTGPGFAEQFAAATVSSLVYFFCNSSSIALIIGLSKRLSVIEVWQKNMVSTIPSFMLAGMLSLALCQILFSSVAGVMFATLPIGSVYYLSVRLSNRTLQKI